MLAGRQRLVLWGCFAVGAGLVFLAEDRGGPQPALARWDEGPNGAYLAVEAVPPRQPPPLPRAVVAAAERHRLDPALVQAVILTESGWNAQAVSEKGAVGLMQVMPETAAWLGFPEAADPAANLEAGCHYLASLLDHFGGDVELALAAYNAGPGAVRQWGTIPPYRETRQFVVRVGRHYRGLTGAKLERAALVPAG